MFPSFHIGDLEVPLYGLIFLETTIAKNQFREDINEILNKIILSEEIDNPYQDIPLRPGSFL